MKVNWLEFGPLPNYERCLRFEIFDAFYNAYGEQWIEITKAVGIICVHNTTLGQALGGLRIKKYNNEAEMVADCARLARGMSYKNAASGLPLGGGKAVIDASPADISPKFLEMLARAVDALGGQYITAPDMNTTPQMMDIVSQHTKYAACLSHACGGLGDPSPWTAKGVFASLQAAAPFVFGKENLDGLKILIQGYGKVGSGLAELCANANMLVSVCDADSARLDEAKKKFSTVSDMLDLSPLDIFSPNAIGGCINYATIGKMATAGVKLVIGGANNQLENAERDMRLLDQYRICWVPDFVANAGGVAQACADWEMRRDSLSREDASKLLNERIAKIGERVKEILKIASGRQMTTLEAAERLAERTVADHGGVLR